MSATITTEELDLGGLAALEKAATPGPWSFCTCGKCGLVWSDGDQETNTTVAKALTNEEDDVPPVSDKQRQANAALIATLRTAAPKLIAAARELAALKAIAADGLKNMDNPDYTGPVVAELANALRSIRGSATSEAPPPTSNHEAIDLPTDEWRAMSPGIAVKGDVPL